jgi:hypothetical protein
MMYVSPKTVAELVGFYAISLLLLWNKLPENRLSLKEDSYLIDS